MKCLLVMRNIYNVDACKSPTLLCYIANKLFGQQWLFEKVEKSNPNDIEKDYDTEGLSPIMKKKQKEIGHLDLILQRKNSIRKMIAEFSFTCYKYMAESLVNVNAKGQTVSYIPYVKWWECGTEWARYQWTTKLKCNTHIILATDNAIGKVFWNTETLIGSPKVILEDANSVVNYNQRLFY